MQDDGLTPLQRQFVEEYVKDLNATQAAIRAGYDADPSNAAVIGSENLRKPKVKAAIDARLAEKSLSKSETLKSISDIARADLKQYFTARQQVHVPKVSITLAEYIERLKEEIENTEYIHDIAVGQGLLGSDEELDAAVAHHRSVVRSMRLRLVALEVRLVKEPMATMIVDGEPELIETAELDVAKLVKDKEAGRIKSFQMTKAGLKVELYEADGALRDLAKYHGLFEADNKQKTFNLKVGYGNDDE